MKFPSLFRAVVLPFLLAATLVRGEEARPANLKTEHFDHDPGWEGFNNRMTPTTAPTVTQDFGYSATSFASKTLSGEIGGVVTRAAEPAWCAAKIAPRTLDDKLSASGTFALTKPDGGGLCFGWFNGKQPSGMGRPMNSLGMMLSTTKTGGRLAIHLITAQNQVTATFVTKFERYKTQEERAEMRPTPIKSDGTRYDWKLDYDPAANDGKGQVRFTIHSESGPAGEFEGKEFTVDLPAGFKQQGTLSTISGSSM